jgi:hypothetical protein
VLSTDDDEDADDESLDEDELEYFLLRLLLRLERLLELFFRRRLDLDRDLLRDSSDDDSLPLLLLSESACLRFSTAVAFVVAVGATADGGSGLLDHS